MEKKTISYICDKKKSYFLFDTSCIALGSEDGLPNSCSSLPQFLEILNSLSLAVETIFRPTKLRSFVICFIIVLPLALECDELSITYLLVFFSPTSRLPLCFFSNFSLFLPENLSPRLFIVSSLVLKRMSFLYLTLELPTTTVQYLWQRNSKHKIQEKLVIR